MTGTLPARPAELVFEAPQLRWFRVRLSTLFAASIMYATIGMFQSFIANDDATAGAGVLSLQIVWAGFYAVAVLWALLDGKRLLTLFFRCKFFLLAPLLALVSSQWAQDAGPTIRRSIGLLFTYLLGAFIALHCGRRLQLKILCNILLAAVVLSYLVEIFAPGWVPVVEQHPGSWNGVFMHKNILAKAMVILVSALLCREAEGTGGRWVKWSGLFAALGLLVLSRAASAVLVMAALFCCFFIVRQLRRGTKTIILVIMLAFSAVAGGSLVVNQLQDRLLQALGKSADLSGRSGIWAAALLSVAKRPFLGYGFHAFWGGENSESLTARAFIPNHWDAPHAHNGYIETALELGFVGVVVIFAGLLLLLWKGLRRYRATGELIDLWPVMLVLAMLFYNLTETMDMVENSIHWILFSAAFFTAAAEQFPPLSPPRQEAG